MGNRRGKSALYPTLNWSEDLQDRERLLFVGCARTGLLDSGDEEREMEGGGNRS